MSRLTLYECVVNVYIQRQFLIRNWTILSWVRMRNFSPVFQMRKGRRRVAARNSRNTAYMAKHKVITFAPIIALATLIAVSPLPNGIVMVWEIQ